MIAQSYASELDVLTGLHEQLVVTRGETEKYRALVYKGVEHIELHHAHQALDNIFLMRENEDLRKGIADQKSEMEGMRASVLLSFTEAQRLSRDNATLLTVLQTKDDEIDDLRRKVDAHVQSHKTTYNLLKQIDNERTGVMVAKTKVVDEVRSMKHKLTMRHEETWAADQKLVEMGEEVENMRREIASLRIELRACKGETTLIGEKDGDCVRLACAENKRQVNILQGKMRQIVAKYPHLTKDFKEESEEGPERRKSRTHSIPSRPNSPGHTQKTPEPRRALSPVKERKAPAKTSTFPKLKI